MIIAYNILLCTEHLILMIPLLSLKMDLDQRNDYLAKDYPPIADEQLSTYIATSLLYYSITGFIALPFVSFLLSYVYFMKAHAWSRILQTQLIS